MVYGYRRLALFWLVVLGLVALSGSAMVVSSRILLLIGAALVIPALVMTLFSTWQSRVGAITLQQTRALIVSAGQDLRSPTTGGIDIYQWENEGGAAWPFGSDASA